MEGRMSKELNAKWLELVAAGKAAWMPGMLSLPPQADRCQRDGQMMVGRLPDFSDPATLGALLGQVRERWKDDRISLVFNVVYGTWMVLRTDDAAPDGKCLIGFGFIEAEALLVALEVAR